MPYFSWWLALHRPPLSLWPSISPLHLPKKQPHPLINKCPHPRSLPGYLFTNHHKQTKIPTQSLTKTHPHRAQYIPQSDQLPTLPNPIHLPWKPSRMHSQSLTESPISSVASLNSDGSLMASEDTDSLQTAQGSWSRDWCAPCPLLPSAFPEHHLSFSFKHQPMAWSSITCLPRLWSYSSTGAYCNFSHLRTNKQ